jgi:hypothetical protein
MNRIANKYSEASHSHACEVYRFLSVFIVFLVAPFARVERSGKTGNQTRANCECAFSAIGHWLLTSYARLIMRHPLVTLAIVRISGCGLELAISCVRVFLRWPYDHRKMPVHHVAAGREEMDRGWESPIRLFASAAAWDFLNIYGLRVASAWKRFYILRSILFYDD